MQCLSLRSGAIAVSHGICVAAYFRSDSSMPFYQHLSLRNRLLRSLPIHKGLHQPGIFYYLQSKKIPRFTNRFHCANSPFNSQIKMHTLSSYELTCSPRMRYAFLLHNAFAYVHANAKNLHCATWDIHPVQIAPSGGIRSLHSRCSFRLMASRVLVIAMEILLSREA